MTRVLIVDDQPSFRRQLRALLKHAGIDDAREANDIPEAESLLHASSFDLAVVDVMLPGVSGLEGVPRLKKILPNMRVIVISALRDRVEIFRTAALAAGAEAFIPKDDLDLQAVTHWRTNCAPTERKDEK